MSFCDQCGEPLGDGEAFCPMCGTRVMAQVSSGPAPVAAQPSLPAEAGQDSKWPGLIGVAAVAAAAGVGVQFVLPTIDTPLLQMGISFAVSFVVGFLCAQLLSGKFSPGGALK